MILMGSFQVKIYYDSMITGSQKATATFCYYLQSRGICAKQYFLSKGLKMLTLSEISFEEGQKGQYMGKLQEESEKKKKKREKSKWNQSILASVT